AHAIHGSDDVGAGLAEQDQHDGRVAVGESVVAQVLHRVAQLGDVAEAHGRAVVVADDERKVILRVHRLVVGEDLPALRAALERALGAVGVGGGDRGAHALGVDAVTVHRGQIQLHAHRGQRAAAHRDIPDAVHLQQLLRQYGGGRVVHLAAG